MQMQDWPFDKQLYLVQGTIDRTEYMAEKGRTFDDVKLVWADSLAEAERKFIAHWEGQTKEYSVYYRVWDGPHASEMIM